MTCIVINLVRWKWNFKFNYSVAVALPRLLFTGTKKSKNQPSTL